MSLDRLYGLTNGLAHEADLLCDRVAIIDEGKLVVVDTPSSLKSLVRKGDFLELNSPT